MQDANVINVGALFHFLKKKQNFCPTCNYQQMGKLNQKKF
jgi:hypothetical protein